RSSEIEGRHQLLANLFDFEENVWLTNIEPGDSAHGLERTDLCLVKCPEDVELQPRGVHASLPELGRCARKHRPFTPDEVVPGDSCRRDPPLDRLTDRVVVALACIKAPDAGGLPPEPAPAGLAQPALRLFAGDREPVLSSRESCKDGAPAHLAHS